MNANAWVDVDDTVFFTLLSGIPTIGALSGFFVDEIVSRILRMLRFDKLFRLGSDSAFLDNRETMYEAYESCSRFK